jgi:hypothetical protein
VAVGVELAHVAQEPAEAASLPVRQLLRHLHRAARRVNEAPAAARQRKLQL